jgi:hypothetical protein
MRLMGQEQEAGPKLGKRLRATYAESPKLVLSFARRLGVRKCLLQVGKRLVCRVKEAKERVVLYAGDRLEIGPILGVSKRPR